VSLVGILLPLRISQEQGVRKETKDNGGFEREHQGRSGNKILLPLRISQEQGVRKETKDNGGFETEYQGRSGNE
jgi:hypothetical protein